MNCLVSCLERACAAFGLEIERDYLLPVGNSIFVKSVASISDTNRKRVMLIFENYADVSPYIDQVLAAGFGFSILSQPNPNEPFDISVYLDMFRDWGFELK
jgi:hypothetical protein